MHTITCNIYVFFRMEQYSALQEVARDLIAAGANGDQKADPEVLKRCAEFFVDHQQYDRALDMYATAKSVSTNAELKTIRDSSQYRLDSRI